MTIKIKVEARRLEEEVVTPSAVASFKNIVERIYEEGLIVKDKNQKKVKHRRNVDKDLIWQRNGKYCLQVLDYKGFFSTTLIGNLFFDMDKDEIITSDLKYQVINEESSDIPIYLTKKLGVIHNLKVKELIRKQDGPKNYIT